MSKSMFFHLRKSIKAEFGKDFGSMKALDPSERFNDDGKITHRWGDFDDQVTRLQKAVGQSYCVVGLESQREIKIKRITDI